MKLRSFAFVLMLLALIACGPSATRTPTLQPTGDTTFIETQVAAKIFATLTASAPNANGGTLGPPAAATPTRTPTRVNIATGVPPTATSSSARPSATRTSAARASVTPTRAATVSGFRRWTVAQVIAAFKSARLEATNPLTLTSKDYAGFPRKPVEGVLFGIPSLCKECGGRVFSFNSKDDLDATRKYLGGVSAGSWFISRGNILVQLNARLSQTREKQYEAAVNALP